MEVAVDANIRRAPKGRKVAQCFARHMVVVKGAHLRAALRVQKGAQLSARATVEGQGVHFKVVGFAQRVCMEGPYSV